MINEIELVKKKKDTYKAIKHINIKDIKDNKEILLHINFDQVPEDTYEVNLYQISTNSKKLIKVIPSNNNQDTNIYYKVPLNNLAIGEYEFEIIINNQETILFKFKVYKKNKLVINIIILSAVLLVGIGGYIIYQNTPNNIELKEKDNKKPVDIDNSNINKGSKEEIRVQDLDEITKKSLVRVSLDPSVKCDINTGYGDFEFINYKYVDVEETTLYNRKMQFEIILNNQSLYTSPLLPPDSFIENITLNVIPDEGFYEEVTARVYFYDMNDNYLGFDDFYIDMTITDLKSEQIIK